jgi:hypothetical protein
MTAAHWIVIAGILIAILTFSAVAFICDWPRPKLKYGNAKVGQCLEPRK